MKNKKCKYCQSDISADAKVCPQCKKDQRNWFRRHIILTIIGAVVILFIVLVVTGDSEKTHQAVEEREQVKNEQQVAELKTTATTMFQEYKSNQVAADLKYKGKVVEISGVVDKISKHIITDAPTVTLKVASAQIFGVKCEFSDASASGLAKLSEGQNVVLKGTVDGYTIGDVDVYGCVLVE